MSWASWALMTGISAWSWAILAWSALSWLWTFASCWFVWATCCAACWADCWAWFSWAFAAATGSPVWARAVPAARVGHEQRPGDGRADPTGETGDHSTSD